MLVSRFGAVAAEGNILQFGAVGDGLTLLRNVRISDVAIASTKLMHIEGTSERLVEGVCLSRIPCKCVQGSIVEYVRDLVLEGVNLTGISGPTYRTNNVTGKGLDGTVPLKPKRLTFLGA